MRRTIEFRCPTCGAAQYFEAREDPGILQYKQAVCLQCSDGISLYRRVDGEAVRKRLACIAGCPEDK